MDNKSTSLEWFIAQLPIRIVNMYQGEIKKAKQMYDEEISEQYGKGYDEGLYDGEYRNV